MGIDELRSVLLERISASAEPRVVMRSSELRDAMKQLSSLSPEDRRQLGQQLNNLRNELEQAVRIREEALKPKKMPIDVTAPFDVNGSVPEFLPTTNGSVHPLMRELELVQDIFTRMGFEAIESREIDDDFHMFESLNFPEDHPARDHYDTFMTTQRDTNGKQLIAPAHTSSMQHRYIAANTDRLEAGESIAAVIPGRVFRNEDLDARHEHTFYQLEGVYVGEGVTVGNLIATLKTFLSEYYQKDIDVKTQPFYFPFTEPSFELALGCPFCDKQGCKVCGEGWIELLGCGMIHPNVLAKAGVDASRYTGFAWGMGIDRLVMMKHNIEDVRHFESAKLDFLRQF